MGIQINGNTDTISALDGSWTSDSATHFTGKVSIGGTLTYEDVTNIDSVGIVTARAGIIDSTLTAGRVVYAGATKRLTDSPNLTFDGNNVTLEDGRLFVKKGTIPSVDIRNSTNTSHARVILQQGAAEGGYFQISREGTNSSSGDGANSVTLLQSSNHPLIIKTNTTERLRCDGDGVKTLNGRFYSAGTFAYIESSSTSHATVTLKKSASGADAIDYLQCRNNANGLLLKIGGDGTIYSPDVLASHEGDTDTKIRFPAADQIQFETGGTNYLKLHRYSSVNFVEAGANAHISLADNGTNIRGILIGNGNASSTGGLRLQAGGGSATFGGGIVMYSHANSTNAGGVYIGKSQGSSGAIIFGNGGTGPTNEYLRIDSNGDLGLGISPVPQDSGAKTLHIHHPDTSGSTARAAIRLTTGISGSAASNGGFFGLDYSNNLYLYNQENGELRVGTNGDQRFRIANVGDVSIGGCDVNTFSNYQTLTIGGDRASTGSGIDLELSNGTIYGRFFADANGLQIGAPASGDYIRFETQNTERVRISSSGQLQISPSGAVKMSFYHDSSGSLNHITSNNGNEIKVSSGNGNSNGIEFWDYTGVNKRCQIDAEGIKFNTDTAADNGLDDYEQGSFTPVMGSHSNINSTSGIDTSHNGTGSYTKIGNMVTVTVDFNALHTNAKDHVLRYITGLPFTSASSNKTTAAIGYQRGLRFVYASDVFSGQSGRYHHLYGHIGGSTTQLSLNASMSYSPYSGWPATHNSTSSMYLRITISYFT